MDKKVANFDCIDRCLSKVNVWPILWLLVAMLILASCGEVDEAKIISDQQEAQAATVGGESEGESSDENLDQSEDSIAGDSSATSQSGTSQTSGSVSITDLDGDGVADGEDAFPNDKTESVDSDNDGIGDNTDNCPTLLAEGVKVRNTSTQVDFSTINDAVESAVNGAVICVAPGTYNEKSIEFPTGLNITLECVINSIANDDSKWCIVDGGGGGLVFYFSGNIQNATLSGFVIQNGSSSYGGGINVNNGASVTFENLHVRGNEATENGGGISIAQSTAVLTQVVVSGNKAHDNGGGISIALNSTVTLSHITVSGNIADNSDSASNNGIGGGIYVMTASNVAVKNSIVWGNGSQETHQHANSAEDFPPGGSLVITNSVVKDGNTSNGNSNLDPKFKTPIDAVNSPIITGNYRIISDSSAEDLGNTDDIVVIGSEKSPIDLGGNPRIVGDGVDAGAYELQ